MERQKSTRTSYELQSKLLRGSYIGEEHKGSWFKGILGVYTMADMSSMFLEIYIYIYIYFELHTYHKEAIYLVIY